MTPRLPGVAPQKAARALERAGWQLDRVKGSHHIYRHPDRASRVVVPMHRRDLAKGTLNQIINGSGLTRDEFLGLLKRDRPTFVPREWVTEFHAAGEHKVAA